MFYILSRIFACTASPWLYILILLGFACFTSKRKVRISCFSAVMVLFLFFSNGYFYGLCLSAYVKPYITDFNAIGHYKYALLPGGFTGYDKWRERTDYGFAADRQVDAIELYKLGKVEKLVVTGDGASCKDGNVEVYLNQLERVWGVNRRDVIIEPEALNTFQNIDYSLKLVPDMRSENTIVVNSAIYMRRTLLSCQKLDFNPAYYATDVNLSREWTWQSWIPDFHVMDEWMRLIHEWIGIIAYKINF